MSTPNPFPFRIPERRTNRPHDPESLFRSLGQRSPRIQHLWAHQADVLRDWHTNHLDTQDLALELPTGTGKTLIGLLIGDFVRRTRDERVAYLCPNRQLAHQVAAMASECSIDARSLVGPQTSYNPDDFNAYEDSSALAVTTYSAIFNTNPRINSANLLILDDAHASEDFIASLWNVDVQRTEHPDIYFALLGLFKDVIPASHMWNLQYASTPYSRSECGKIPSPIAQRRHAELREFLDTTLEKSDLRFSWGMIRDHLEACHIFISWPSISIRPITPPTFTHNPFANARQRLYMSATLGAGGELERIIGVRRIDRLPAPEGWDRQGTGRRFIIFPDRSLPPETSASVATALAGDSPRSLILAPSRFMAKSVSDRLETLTPPLAIYSASDIEHSLQPFLNANNAALVLHNRYDGLDLPGDACHFEWICGLPGATNAQEAFLLNRLGTQSLLRDRVRTRLTQALGRCTRNATDHAVVILSGPGTLDFCNKVENRTGFHPELQAEIQYGLAASQVQFPEELIEQARAFLEKRPGWEQVDEWIREERDSYPQLEDPVSQTLMANVRDEIDFANAIWVGDYQRALEKARACADRLSGNDLAGYRAWWCYLAGSTARLLSAGGHSEHLRDTVRDLFSRACAASPTATWFREASRTVEYDHELDDPGDDMTLSVAEAIESRLQQVGVAGPAFEHEAQLLLDQLQSADAKTFEQGLERLGQWLGVSAIRPQGQGVPDGIWSFADKAIIAFEAKSEEQPNGPISLDTAREASGHINWVRAKMRVPDEIPTCTVILSDRTTVSDVALPNAAELFVFDLTRIRKLGQRVVSTVRRLRAEASTTANEDFRRVVAERLQTDKLDPNNLLSELRAAALGDFPVRRS